MLKKKADVKKQMTFFIAYSYLQKYALITPAPILGNRKRHCNYHVIDFKLIARACIQIISHKLIEFANRI